MTKTMLYKAGGPHKFDGNDFDYIITEDIDAAKKDGWCLSTTEALVEPKKSPKTPKKAKK